ncbi:uncharacterized protein LOC143037375 [Oratosquilla oratoria]|uniref:uncharacterized protein LOC143037375 n=1 Tax=Oratosquilla oratoria TaxID=337810 RepID=UPI003F75971B
MSPRVILALMATLVLLAEARGGRNLCTSELNDIMKEIKEAITKESCPAHDEESEMKMTKPAVVEDSVVSQVLRHQNDLISNLLEQGKGISQILSTLEEDSKAHKHDVHSLQTTFNEHKKSWSSSQEEISVMQSDMHILKEEVQLTKRDIESVTVQVQEIVLNAETSAENVDDTMEQQSDRLSELADVLKALQLEMADLRDSLDEQAEDIKNLKMRGFRRPGPRGGGGGGGGGGDEEEEEDGEGGEPEERPVGRPGGGRRRRPGGRRRPAGINERSLGSVLPEECSPPFMGVADGCFAVYTNMRLSWENAKEHCGRMQGDLAHPSNLPDFLFYLAEAFPGGWVFWVGGERTNAQETWKWPNGKLIDAPHDFWGRGEPRHDEGADCMYLHSYWGYRAGADPCSEEKYFICQQPSHQQTRPFRRQGDEPPKLQA